ncbi:lysophospholipid acyltransferase family protein [Streptomyces sp. NPDC091266]|uniref:lysophospholipid acyltransferase family protein n=1 Tax=Streptomyces sp. NPDC091266 TaxID=3365978 RepID=UPI0038037535
MSCAGGATAPVTGATGGAWDVHSDCTPDCAAHTAPRVPPTETARRCAAFARTVRRVLADGGRPADPVRLRAHARALLTALGIRLDVTGGAAGPERTEGAHATGGAGGGLRVAAGGPGTLVVGNHISWLDILALLAVEPVTHLAKREVGGWPVVGGLARSAGSHFIDRSSPRQLPHTIAALTDLLAAGHSVAVFPQATTWCTADQGTFRRATFQAAIDAGAPVRPVTVAYTQQGGPSTVAAFCGEDTFLSSLRRVLTARGLTVRVTPHPPLTAADAGDRRTLAALAARTVLGGRTRPPAPAIPAPRPHV